jgi:hypothetical protein
MTKHRRKRRRLRQRERAAIAHHRRELRRAYVVDSAIAKAVDCFRNILIGARRR